MDNEPPVVDFMLDLTIPPIGGSYSRAHRQFPRPERVERASPPWLD